MTKQQAAMMLLGADAAFDCAVPQPWADHVKKITGVYPCGFTVWLYDEQGGIFGRPYPLTCEGARVLGQYAEMGLE